MIKDIGQFYETDTVPVFILEDRKGSSNYQDRKYKYIH